jgi:hypothetical protein
MSTTNTITTVRFHHRLRSGGCTFNSLSLYQFEAGKLLELSQRLMKLGEHLVVLDLVLETGKEAI